LALAPLEERDSKAMHQPQKTPNSGSPIRKPRWGKIWFREEGSQDATHLERGPPPEKRRSEERKENGRE
jgi:hypothetical protein